MMKQPCISVVNLTFSYYTNIFIFFWIQLTQNFLRFFMFMFMRNIDL